MADKIQALVTVAAREGFPGFYSAGRHFTNGTSEHELEPAEFDAIKADQDLGLPIAVMDLLAGRTAAADRAQAAADAAKAVADKAKADAESVAASKKGQK